MLALGPFIDCTEPWSVTHKLWARCGGCSLLGVTSSAGCITALVSYACKLYLWLFWVVLSLALPKPLLLACQSVLLHFVDSLAWCVLHPDACMLLSISCPKSSCVLALHLQDQT